MTADPEGGTGHGGVRWADLENVKEVRTALISLMCIEAYHSVCLIVCSGC